MLRYLSFSHQAIPYCHEPLTFDTFPIQTVDWICYRFCSAPLIALLVAGEVEDFSMVDRILVGIPSHFFFLNRWRGQKDWYCILSKRWAVHLINSVQRNWKLQRCPWILWTGPQKEKEKRNQVQNVHGGSIQSSPVPVPATDHLVWRPLQLHRILRLEATLPPFWHQGKEERTLPLFGLKIW